jgi:4,5-DOPA dioxygenase extradiol
MSARAGEHYLPMLYVLAAKEKNDSISYFNDQPVAGSLTMTSFVLG